MYKRFFVVIPQCISYIFTHSFSLLMCVIGRECGRGGCELVCGFGGHGFYRKGKMEGGKGLEMR